MDMMFTKAKHNLNDHAMKNTRHLKVHPKWEKKTKGENNM